jgi:integrase
MKKKLTDASVARLPLPATGRSDCWDLLLPGFGLRVSATGRRTWNLIRRKPGGKNPVREKLGEFPAMGVAEARARARAALAEPAVSPVKLEELIEQFLAHGRTRKGRSLRQNSVDQYRRNLANYAAPLHRRAVAEIHRRDIAALLHRVSITSGAPTARLVRAMLARLWAYAIEVGLVEYNVVSGTPGYVTSQRDRVLSDHELRLLWAATEEPEAYHIIIRLLLLLGCRRSEIGSLRWSELVDGELRLPSSRTKNGLPLVLPLPEMARAELARWPRAVGRDLLFGGHSPRGFGGWTEAKHELDARLCFDRPWRVHDCRRTVETRLASLGVPKQISDKILNHAAPAVTRAYDHYDYLRDKGEALQRWADALKRIVFAPGGQVVTLEAEQSVQ